MKTERDQRDQKRAMLRLLHYLSQVRTAFALSMILLFLVSALTAAKAWIIQPAVDLFRQGALTSQDLLGLSALIAALFLLQAALTWTYSLVARVAGSRVIRAIREDLFAYLVRRGLGSAHDPGEFHSRIVNDVVAFESSAVGDLQLLIRDGFTLLLLLGVLFYQSRELAALSLAVLGVLGVLLGRLNRRVRLLSRQVQERMSALSRQIGETIGGIEVAVTFGFSERWRDEFRQRNAEHYQAMIRLQRESTAATAFSQALMGLALAAVFVLAGQGRLRGEISDGQFLSFLTTMYLLQGPAVGIGQKLMFVSRGLVAGIRALELFDDQPAVEEPVVPVALQGGDLGFEFENVRFGYNGRPVVRGVSLQAAPRELVVLMGESGGGKTTLARLLLRFHLPQSGTVSLGGVPVARLSRQDLGRAIGYVSQDVFLFEGTIRSNLVLGRPDAPPEEIASVLRTCCLDEFLAELPHGLETRIGERGLGLSGGQRQRLAIARALLPNPSVLILDEATAALDAQLERRLLQNLVESSRRRTILAITHRPGVAERADRLFILRDGKLMALPGLRTPWDGGAGEH